MTFDFHPEAEAEFIEAVSFYDKVESSLGEEFSLEVLAALSNVLSYPNAWPTLEVGVRRCLVNRFPYGILYGVEPDRGFVLALMHLHRRPGLLERPKLAPPSSKLQAQAGDSTSASSSTSGPITSSYRHLFEVKDQPRRIAHEDVTATVQAFRYNRDAAQLMESYRRSWAGTIPELLEQISA